MTNPLAAPPKGAFSSGLSDAYFAGMDAALEKFTASWMHANTPEYKAYYNAAYSWGRMDQMVDAVLPWMKAAIPNLANSKVLEIGCGTGSSTAGLATATAEIFGFDIEHTAIELARTRCALVAQCVASHAKVQLEYRDTSWIDAFAADPAGYFPVQADVAFAYALFEHLLPLERIKLLQALWAYLPIGGCLVTVELPNRLALSDWHTLGLPFADILPTELFALYAAQSDRVLWKGIVAQSAQEAGEVSREQQFRMGRGMSYHEFMLALPADSFEIIGNDRSPNAINRSTLGGYDQEYQDLLGDRLAKLTPPIDASFAAPCLDLIIQKTK